MILQLFCAFVFGMFGAFLFPTISFDQNLSNFPLWLLLFCVGLDCGKNKDIFPALKKYGLVIFLIPVCILISSLFGAFIAGAIVGNPANLSFAVGSGMGFYTLSSSILFQRGYSDLALISFGSNLIREMLALLLTPLLIRYSLFAPAAAAASAADTILPVISKFTNDETTIISLISSVVLTFLVPILIEFFLTIRL